MTGALRGLALDLHPPQRLWSPPSETKFVLDQRTVPAQSASSSERHHVFI
jgi:hypothetical protein